MTAEEVELSWPCTRWWLRRTGKAWDDYLKVWVFWP